MSNFVIIADDLTGANASGSLIKKRGLDTATIIGEMDTKIDASVITYSTDSRAIEPDEAYHRVYEATKALAQDTILTNKRIDSTLRGNVGAEIDAMIDVYKQEKIALVVPVYPSLGRVCIGGIITVEGIPLQLTQAAQDPKTPISTSVVRHIIQEQTKYSINNISLDIVAKGVDAITAEIRRLSQEGTKIIIIDAINDDDIRKIAKAGYLSNVPFFSVDPGPFTAAVIDEDIYYHNQVCKQEESNILMVVGSVTNTTKQQLRYLARDNDVFIYSLDASNLILDDSTRENSINNCVDQLINKMKRYKVVCITTTQLENDYKLNLKKIAYEKHTTVDKLSNIINNSLGEIAAQILKEVDNCKSIFSSGGDVTVAICNKLGIHKMSLEDEVLPLAVYGVLEGNQFKLNIVTKGGLIGDEKGMKICINYLKNIKEVK